MATTYYNTPKDVTLTNISSAPIKVQLYRVNLWEDIKAGDSISLTCDSSEEFVYYQNITLDYGTDKDGNPTVLTCTPAE